MTMVVDFLLMEYAQQVAKEDNVPLEKAIATLREQASLMLFRQFCFNYLNTHRPSAISHAESNFIIQMMDGKKFAVCPGAANLRGTMQPSGYVPVTGRETLMEMQRNVNGMRGEMTPLGQQQDLRQPSQAFSFDQSGLFQRPQP